MATELGQRISGPNGIESLRHTGLVVDGSHPYADKVHHRDGVTKREFRVKPVVVHDFTNGEVTTYFRPDKAVLRELTGRSI